MEAIKKGSIESLLVPLRDRLGNVVDLSTVTGLVFDTKRKDDDSAVESNITVQVDVDKPMTAICSISTTLAGYVVDEEYKLYLKFTAGSESPVLGPIFFRVISD